MTATKLDNFTHAYVMAAFWTNDDEAPSGDYEQSGRFEELFPKLAEEALAKMTADCEKFQKEQSAHLEACGLNSSQAGHDFWLTRNGHGAGFWGRDCEDDLQSLALVFLTNAAKAFGGQDLYLGDDGKYYV